MTKNIKVLAGDSRGLVLGSSLSSSTGTEPRWIFKNPVESYLKSLGPGESKRVMRTCIQRFVNLFSPPSQDEKQVDIETVDWSALNHQVFVFAKSQLEASELSLSTMLLTLTAVRGVAKHAWLMEIISTDLYLKIKQSPMPTGTRLLSGRALPLDQLLELIAICRADKGPAAARDLAMLSVMLVTGVRRSELINIDLKHIDREEGSIRILGKGNKERLVYLDDEALEDVLHWADSYLPYDSGALFPRVRKGGDVTSERLTSQSVRFILENRCLMAGMQVARPHDMRRSFITHLLDSTDPLTVRQMAGHASLATTERYDRRGERNKKAAARAFRKPR